MQFSSSKNITNNLKKIIFINLWKKDLKMFPNGLKTILGEKGINLSGF